VHVTRRLLLPALLLAVLAAAWPSAAAAAPPAAVFGGTVPCAPREGVIFCGGTADTRVRTFDAVPLDVSVGLPAEGAGPYPLVVLLHGYGGRKSGFDDVAKWVRKGYAVLTYTARGFNESCGTPPNRDDPVCLQRGWVRLADSRYEVRDTQQLAGILADEGIADPQRIGPTGPSYAGGQSLALALLKDRIWDAADDKFKPWTSPQGKPMRIAAAAPWIPWSDLVYSLVPNGRTLDYAVAPPQHSLLPPGVMKESFVSGLYASGEATGQYAPPGADRDADLRTWYPRVQAGEPYTDPLAQDIFAEISAHHQSYTLPIPAGGVPPLLISNGFTDDLFPVDEALRLVNRLRVESPNTPIRQLHMDYGHQRGQNKAADTALLERRIMEWFDHYLKGEGAAPAQVVEARTQACPKDAPSGGPFTAPTWGALHPGEVRVLEPAARTLSSAGGDESVGRAVDPIAGGGACATTSSRDLPQTATYRFPAVTGEGFTLLGSPTVVADLAVSGANAQVAARLWDVAPDGGPQTLVARGLYRPDPSGRQVFQLHPGAYRFEPGHVPKLELLGRDAPYARPSNGTFSVTVSNADLRLPIAEGPTAAPAGQVEPPADPVLPPGQTPAPEGTPPGTEPRPLTEPSAPQRPGPGPGPGAAPAPPRPSGSTRATPPSRRVSVRTRYPRRSRGRCGGAVLRLSGPGLDGARTVEALLAGRRIARDTRAPWTLRLKGSQARRAPRISVRVLRADGTRRTVTRRLRRCR